MPSKNTPRGGRRATSSRRADTANARTGPKRSRHQSEPETLDAALTTPPPTPDALHTWIERTLAIRIARTPLLDGHRAPFDYLCHAFFEGRTPGSIRAVAGTPLPTADCVVWANRGGGKTFLGALATLLDLIFKRGIQVRILAGSLEQSRRMHDHLRRFLAAPALEPLNAKITSRRVTLPTGSCAEILAASQTSVRGTRVQKIRCDEVDLFDPEVWDAAQLVTRSMPCPGPWGDTVRGCVEALSTMHRPYGLMWKIVGEPAIATASAPGQKNDAGLVLLGVPARRGVPLFRWGLLDVLEPCADEHVCAACPLEPECQGRAKTLIAPGSGGHITIADAVAMKRRVGRTTWESEMLCLRPSRSSTVYPEFDHALHVIDDPAAFRFVRFYGGMDFGYRSESVCLLAGETDDHTLVVLREHCRTETVVAEMLAAFAGWIDQGTCAAPGSGRGSLAWIAIDPAGLAVNDQTGEANAKLVREAGYTPRWRKSKIAPGIHLVRARLAPAWNFTNPAIARNSPSREPASQPATPLAPTPRLLVHRACTRLIECLACYRYPEQDKETPTPLKDGNDHACDALRYLVQNLDAPARCSVSSYM